MLMSTATCNAKAWLFGKGRQHYDGTISSGRHYLFGPSRHSTMKVRMEAQFKSAQRIIHWLEQQPEVEKILWPAHEKDPGYPIWKRDFTGASAFVRCQVERQHS